MAKWGWADSEVCPASLGHEEVHFTLKCIIFVKERLLRPTSTTSYLVGSRVLRGEKSRVKRFTHGSMKWSSSKVRPNPPDSWRGHLNANDMHVTLMQINVSNTDDEVKSDCVPLLPGRRSPFPGWWGTCWCLLLPLTRHKVQVKITQRTVQC